MSRNINKFKTLESIANGIHAANKIKTLSKPEVGGDNRAFLNKDSITLLSQILESIAEYSPGSYGEPITDINRQCCKYCSAYRNFKTYIMNDTRGGLKRDRFVNSLSALEPIMDTRKKFMLDKILKIYNLFN